MKPPAAAAGTRAWRIFASGVICQACAGHVYWFPAVGTGLQESLGLSPAQLTSVLAASNSGSWLGFVAGILYTRIGARRTAAAGAVLSAFAYALLAILTVNQIHGPIAYLVALSCAVVLVSTSFWVYSTAMTCVAALYPRSVRGQIMAFHASMFGMSAGVFGLLQDAFAPSVKDTPRALAGAAILAALPAIIAFRVFPNGMATADTSIERQPLIPTSSRTSRGVSDTTLLKAAFSLALAVVCVLQVAVYLSWIEAKPIVIPQILDLQPLAFRPQVICATLLLLLLASFFILPLYSSPFNAYQEEQAIDEPPATPFIDVLRDLRYQLILGAFFVLPGSGAIGTLLNASGVIASRRFIEYTGSVVPSNIATADTVAAAVRAVVIAFSAASLLGRLATVLYADARGGTVAWKMRLLEGVCLVMACALAGVAVARGPALIAAVAAVGAAHGTFFALSPPLVALWFGVDGFPLNFAVGGVTWAIAVATTGSTIPIFLAGLVEQYSWIELHVPPGDATERYCSGTLCYAPSFFGVAVLCLTLAFTFRALHGRVVDMSKRTV